MNQYALTIRLLRPKVPSANVSGRSEEAVHAVQLRKGGLCRGPFLCDHLQRQLLRGRIGCAVVTQYSIVLAVATSAASEGRMAVPTGVRVAVRIRPLLAREARKLA